MRPTDRLASQLLSAPALQGPHRQSQGRLAGLLLLVLAIAGCPSTEPGTTVIDTVADTSSDTADAADTSKADSDGKDSADTGTETVDVTEGPGFGIDYSTSAPGATPRYDVTAEDWLAVGWPSDRWRRADGTPDLSNFPNPVDSDLLTAYTKLDVDMDGWGLNGSVYLTFNGSLELGTLPSARETQDSPTATVQLVNVTPTSPAFGVQSPLVFRWYPTDTSDHYADPQTLALRPVFGRPLREAETYCAVVTRALKDADDNYLQQSPAFLSALDTEPHLAPLLTWLRNGAPFNREDVATATCFTTQDATGQLRKIRDVLDAAPQPMVLDVQEPVVWGEFHGTFEQPNFQTGTKPYADVGGGITFDSDGLPVVQDQELVRFLLLVPKDRAMPDAGWPVVHYAHGTGGDYESCRGRANNVLGEGSALLCVDQPLHGIRGPNGNLLDGTALILYSFNFFNPESGRMSFRQSAADSLTLNRMITAGRFDLTAAETSAGVPVRLDPAKIFFFGHSHGATSGALLMAVDPIPKAAVLSGGGGVLLETILRRKDPTDLSALIQTALQVPKSELDTFHPTLTLVQMLVDTTDPINYAPYWLNPASGGPGKHMIVTEGIDDHASPSITAEALASAAGLPLIGDIAKQSEPHDLQDLPQLDLPVSLNIGTGAEARTAVFKQYQEGDHYVALWHPQAQALWRTFFRTLISQEEPVTVGIGGASVVRTLAAAPGESCPDATAIEATDLPVEVIGDTTLATDDHSAAGCGTSDGVGRRDQVWSFTPAETGQYRIRTTFESNADKDTPRPQPNRIYMVTDCNDMAASCVTFGIDETVTLQAGTTLFIVIDGFGANDIGSYRLTVSQSCQELECGARECGQWGCGSCGSCAGGEVCNEGGTCDDAPAGDSCGDAMSVGALPFEATGNTNDFSNLYGYQAADCPGMNEAYGNGSGDAVYAWTVATSGRVNLSLEAAYAGNLYVVEDCSDIANSCLGADRRGGGERIQLDVTAGQSLFVIVDGYLSSVDEGAYTLRIDTCVPQCDGKACGSDGCGGSCGACAAPGSGSGGERCVESETCTPFSFTCATTSECVAVPTGDRCADPFVVDVVPFTAQASTSPMGNDYGYVAGQCPGENGGYGAGSKDAVYEFVPTETGIYRVAVLGLFDKNLYIATTCGPPIDGCVEADEVAGADRNEVMFPTLTADQTYYIFVDGRGNTSNQAGGYTLSVDTCSPNCEGKVCGSDGCGGSCGSCVAGERCNGASQCVITAGLTCESPHNVDVVPFTHYGDSTGSPTSYTNTCDAQATGGPSPNVAYSFTAPAAGFYTVAVSAGWNAQVYAVSDCNDITASCVENPGTSTITRAFAENEQVFFIVDGASPTGVDVGPYAFRLTESCNCQAPKEFCHDNVCSGPDDVEGSTCAVARPVGALPFVGEGDTSQAEDNYGVGNGQCLGFEEMGRGSNDEAWAFTAPAAGDYKVSLATDGWDGAVYVTTDCTKLQATCIGAGDRHYPLTDTATVTLAAGQSVWVIVDGADNVQNDAGSYQLMISALN